jgi:hypothetical protein
VLLVRPIAAKKGGLKGSKLAGAVSGSLLGFLALAAVGMVAFMIYARRSRRYALHLDDVSTRNTHAHTHTPARSSGVPWAHRLTLCSTHDQQDMSSSAPQQSSAPANLEAGSQSQGVNSASMVL